MSRTEPIYRQIGRRLKEAREAAGLTQSDVARKLGVTPAGYSRWESGVRRISVDELRAVAAIINSPVSVLVGETLDTEQLAAWQLSTLPIEDKALVSQLIAFLLDRRRRSAA